MCIRETLTVEFVAISVFAARYQWKTNVRIYLEIARFSARFVAQVTLA